MRARTTRPLGIDLFAPPLAAEAPLEPDLLSRAPRAFPYPEPGGTVVGDPACTWAGGGDVTSSIISTDKAL